MSEKNRSRLMLIASMLIFGTIGVFRKYIPLPSSVIAMLRGAVGALFLMLIMVIGHKKSSVGTIRRRLPFLFLSGAAMGFNWILLFEAYNYTSVATATLCYYMAPVFVILLSPFVLKERLTVKKAICAVLSLVGIVLVSGVSGIGIRSAEELMGVALGLGAAALYACVMLMNKKTTDVPAYDRTVWQLVSAAVVLFVYTCFCGDLAEFTLTVKSGCLLAVVCIVHTGVAYALYFGSMTHLSGQTLALFSYLDPVVAVLLSALFLSEPMTVWTGIGAVLILGGALFGELPDRQVRTKL